jgi:hypothetical protein
LSQVQVAVEHLGRDVAHLATASQGQTDKLDQLMRAVTVQQARSSFDPVRAIDVVHKTVSVLMMLVVPVAGVLIWMIVKTTAADFATAQVRMNEVIMPEIQRMRDKQDELVRRFVWRSGTTVEGAR